MRVMTPNRGTRKYSPKHPRRAHPQPPAAVAATDNGRLAPERAAGIGRREARHAMRPRRLWPSGSYRPRTGATGVPAARRRPGAVAADVPGRSLRAARIPIRAPAVAATDCGRRARTNESRPDCRTFGASCATGVQAARRHAVAIPMKWPLAGVLGRGALRATCIPIRALAVAARDRGRRAGWAVGIGRREARYATKHGQPEGIPGAPPPRACSLLVGIPRRGRPPTGLDSQRNGARSTSQPRADHRRGRSTLRPPCIPIRLPAVAATERGRRDGAAGTRKRGKKGHATRGDRNRSRDSGEAPHDQQGGSRQDRRRAASEMGRVKKATNPTGEAREITLDHEGW
jgi:hypothetical protein